MKDPWRIELIERDGVMRCEVGGYDDWAEPICPSCDQPIRWVLDMISFSSKGSGVHTMMHARCAWIPEAFAEQARLAREQQSTPEVSR